eukprot:3684915-Pleurochrysis_carterae.AAC.2
MGKTRMRGETGEGWRKRVPESTRARGGGERNRRVEARRRLGGAAERGTTSFGGREHEGRRRRENGERETQSEAAVAGRVRAGAIGERVRPACRPPLSLMKLPRRSSTRSTPQPFSEKHELASAFTPPSATCQGAKRRGQIRKAFLAASKRPRQMRAASRQQSGMCRENKFVKIIESRRQST